MAPKRKMEGSPMDVERVAKRKPDRSEGYVHLLSEVAPELGLRGIHADGASSATVCRALLSVLLRAGTTGEARDAYNALCAASDGAADCKCETACVHADAQLGASARGADAALADVAGAVARGGGPRADGAALALYSSAGIGASDADDFDDPPRDGLSESAAFGRASVALQDARANNAALALHHFARSARDARGAARLVDDVAPRIATLRAPALRALQTLLAARVACGGEPARADAVTRVVNAFSVLANSAPGELAHYARSLADAELKFRACELFLSQFCGTRRIVRDPRTMGVLQFVQDFVEIRVRKRRRCVVPGVVTALAEAWLQLAGQTCFEVSEGKQARVDLLNRMNTRALQLLDNCGAAEPDGRALKRVVFAVEARVFLLA